MGQKIFSKNSFITRLVEVELLRFVSLEVLVYFIAVRLSISFILSNSYSNKLPNTCAGEK